MASFYGTSKIWGEVCVKLATTGIKVGRPSDIETLLESCLSEYSQKFRQTHHRLEADIWKSEMDLLQEKERVNAELLSISNFASLEIAQAEANLDLLRHDRSIFNLIRNIFRARRESRKISRIQAELQVKQQSLKIPLETRETELLQKKGSIDELARQEWQDLITQIELLKNIFGSQELGVASTELEMLEYLKQLPDDFQVINNINLTVDRGFLFEGKWLTNGHIDHLVITPSGLFAIEVKNWNRETSDKDSTIDPFRQIKYSAQLCYEMIKPAFPDVSMRSILAFKGHAPDFQTSGIVKSIPLPEVPGYIIWFNDNTLSSQTIIQLRNQILDINKNNS